MAKDYNFFPPILDSGIPQIISNDQLINLRRIMGFLKTFGTPKNIAEETKARMASITDENGRQIFSDQRETSPTIVMIDQLSYLGALNNFYASNIPLLIEDFIISLTGERPIEGLPNFVWVVYEMNTTLDFDYTIPAGIAIRDKSKTKRYTSVYPTTIPAGMIGNEVNSEDGVFKYRQLYRADQLGTSQKVAALSLTELESGLAYIRTAWNPRESFGGRDPEKFRDYRLRVFQAPNDNQIITPDDHIAATKNFLGPGARAIIIASDNFESYNEINTIRISAIHPDGSILTNENGGISLIEFLESKDPNSTIIIEPPKITNIVIDVQINLERYSKADEDAIKKSVIDTVGSFANPSNWEDWGEYENNVSTDKLIYRIKSSLPNEIDTVKISYLSYVDNHGIDRVYTDIIPDVRLKNITGLPNIIIRNITLRKESNL